MKNFVKSKICFFIIFICLICTSFIIVNALSNTTSYDVQKNEVSTNNSEEKIIKNWEMYLSTVTKMYNVEGSMITIKKWEKDIYKNRGWFEEPVILMYASNGETVIVEEANKDTYINSGWFLTLEEARFSTVNKRELELLARTIHAEAADNNYTDRCYAGMVVMNRKNSGLWGNSIESVIKAPGQYSCYNNKKFNSPIPEECYTIAKQIMLGETFGVPYNVIFQSSCSQGTGIWKIVYNTAGYNNYYCYGNI